MPEWLMGTDCKSVGNMPTLVQIQLDPTNILNINLLGGRTVNPLARGRTVNQRWQYAYAGSNPAGPNQYNQYKSIGMVIFMPIMDEKIIGY